jgi:hypothetical protein
LAPSILAPLTIYDPIGITNIQSILCAESPYGVLDVATENLWKVLVELSRVYLASDLFDKFRTAISLVTSRPVWMFRVKPRKNSSSVKKLMHQRIDGNHAAAGFMPMSSGILGGEQNACES